MYTLTSEHLLLFNILLLLGYGIISGLSSTKNFQIIYQNVHYLSIILLLNLILFIVNDFSFGTIHFNYLFSKNIDVQMIDLIITVFTFLYLIVIYKYQLDNKLYHFEYIIIILFSLLSSFLIISSNEFFTLYVMLEFQGICFYILSAFNRNYKISLEAGLKYLIVNSISSSLLLFGFSLIYMYSGLTFFEDIYYYFNYIDNVDSNITLILGINIFTFGLFFKIYAVPFHLWIPDIYAGAPISTTLFISTIPLIVNFYLFIKFYFYIFIYSNTLWFFLILFISVLSMFLGCLGVAYEHELKRLVAYSSIYNTGFILSLFLLSYPELPDDIFSYILSYVLGLFAFFILLLNLRNSKNNKNIEVIDDLYGIFKYNKYLTFFFAMCVFQLSGVPPFISFITKIALQGELVSKSEYIFIFIIIVITTTVNIYGYLRLLKSLIFEKTNNIVYFNNIKYHIYVILSILLFISVIGISINGEEFFDFLSEYIVFNFYN